KNDSSNVTIVTTKQSVSSKVANPPSVRSNTKQDSNRALQAVNSKVQIGKSSALTNSKVGSGQAKSDALSETGSSAVKSTGSGYYATLIKNTHVKVCIQFSSTRNLTNVVCLFIQSVSLYGMPPG